MNGWDLFTWISAAALAGSAVLIFAFFLRDVGSILRGKEENRDEE